MVPSAPILTASGVNTTTVVFTWRYDQQGYNHIIKHQRIQLTGGKGQTSTEQILTAQARTYTWTGLEANRKYSGQLTVVSKYESNTVSSNMTTAQTHSTSCLTPFA